MINEDKKETCHTAFIAVSHKIVGLHPTYKYPCHSERRIDLRVSESHTKIDSQHKEEIPEQVQNDMKGKFLVPQCPSILVKPSRGTSEARVERQTTETLSFRGWRERCRLTRGAAFTLAEVLITLGIIGVVAAMTMPMLMAKYRAKVLRTQFLQANTIVGDALNRAKIDEIDLNEIINNRDTASLYKYFKSGSCTLPQQPAGQIYYNYCANVKANPAASPLENPYCINNGMTLWLGKINKMTDDYKSWVDTGFTIIAIDINGWQKKPNKYGHDLFFWVYNNSQGTFRPLNSENLRAIGLNDYLAFASTFYNSCPGDCTGQSEAGIACTPNALSDPDYFKKLAL